MNRFALVSFMAIAVGHGAFAYAQDLLGSYSGSLTYHRGHGGEGQAGVQLFITSVDGDVVKGTATVYSGDRFPCRGDYPMEGNYEGNKLTMHETQKGGPTSDCIFRFIVVHDGNKLQGTRGTTGSGLPIWLSK